MGVDGDAFLGAYGHAGRQGDSFLGPLSVLARVVRRQHARIGVVGGRVKAGHCCGTQGCVHHDLAGLGFLLLVSAPL